MCSCTSPSMMAVRVFVLAIAVGSKLGPRTTTFTRCSDQPPAKRLEWLAGAPGFEPGNGGIKIRCLTSWLRPIAGPTANANRHAAEGVAPPQIPARRIVPDAHMRIESLGLTPSVRPGKVQRTHKDRHR